MMLIYVRGKTCNALITHCGLPLPASSKEKNVSPYKGIKNSVGDTCLQDNGNLIALYHYRNGNARKRKETEGKARKPTETNGNGRKRKETKGNEMKTKRKERKRKLNKFK